MFANLRFAGTFPLDALSGVAEGLLNFEVPDTADCRACYNCKFPEMRVRYRIRFCAPCALRLSLPAAQVVFWLVATTTSIVSPDYFREFEGNVTQNCMVTPQSRTLPRHPVPNRTHQEPHGSSGVPMRNLAYSPEV